MGSVLIIGAQGVLGNATASAFEAEGWDVRRGGRRPDQAAGFDLVDLDRPETLEPALAGVDLVVNTVPDSGLTAERTVLDRGGVLINVSALPYAAAQELRAEAGESRGLVVMNAGRTPGISNLVAADLLAAHPAADAVEIAFSLSTSGASGRAGGEFLYRNLRTAGRHATAVIPFPAPLGPRRCLEFAEPQRGWLGELAEGRAVRAYVCFLQRGATGMLLALNRLGVMSRVPRGLFVRPGRVDPDRHNLDPVREWIAVSQGDRRLAARTIEGEGGYPMTAAATLALAEALLDRRPRPTGCLDPHEVVALDALLSPLAGRGVRVVERLG